MTPQHPAAEREDAARRVRTDNPTATSGDPDPAMDFRIVVCPHCGEELAVDHPAALVVPGDALEAARTAESILAKVRTMPGLVGITESEINRRELSDWITEVFLSAPATTETTP